MTLNPKVSIIIPVYNGSNYLAEAIESSLAQTYSNIEILIVNDGSNDNGKTDKIIRSYGNKVRSITKENGGVASALNVGITHMTGDYASWLSHDDLYYPEKIEKQLNFLKTLKNDKAIVYSNYAIFTNNPHKPLPVIMEAVSPENFHYWLAIKNQVHGCTLLVPRQAFKDVGVFDEKLKTTQDYDLWFRMAETYKFVHLPDILVKARSHKDQDTLKKTDLIQPECNALLIKFIRNLTKDEICRATQKPLDISYDEIASSMWARGFKEAEKVAKELANLYRPSKKRMIELRSLKSIFGRLKVIARQCLPPNVIFMIKCLIKKELN